MRRPRLLTIAGSDSGGGAGIQADLKTFAVLGCYGMSAVTAITAQNTRTVDAVVTLSGEIVAAQIDAVFGDIGVDAVKIGMLAESETVLAVADRLRAHREEGRPPIVLDPVMVAKSGDRLLAPDAIDALRSELLPLATLVTPNLPEAEELLGERISDPGDAEEAATRLVTGGTAVLLKGGHASEHFSGSGARRDREVRDHSEVVDLLATSDSFHRFTHRRVDSNQTHGTGCTLSSAIAAGLGRGDELVEAVRAGLDFVHGAIVAAEPLGEGHGPVDHLHALAGGRIAEG